MSSPCWRRERRVAWCLCGLFSNLVCCNLRKKTQSAMGPTYPRKKSILVLVPSQPSPKFLPLSPHGQLIDPSWLSRSEKFTGHCLKERLSLSLRGSRRCHRAAAWTGNFRGLTFTHMLYIHTNPHMRTHLFIRGRHKQMNVVNEH